MGCVEWDGSYLRPLEIVSHYVCDAWAVPHFLNPFLFTLWTRNPLAGLLIAAVGELVEYTVLLLFRSFIIFLGDAGGTENVAAIIFDDIMWMGGGGALLGLVFCLVWDFPILLRGCDIAKWRFWKRMLVFMGSGVALASFLYRLSWPLGAFLFPLFHVPLLYVAVRATPRKQSAPWYWAASLALILPLQEIASYFYSSHLQVTLIASIYAALLLLWGNAKHKWTSRWELKN